MTSAPKSIADDKDFQESVLSILRGRTIDTELPMLPIVPILTGVSDGVIPYVGDRFRRKMLDPSVVIASTKVAPADFDMTASLKALMDPKPYLEKMTQDILTGRRHADDYHLTRRVDNETARLEELRLEGFLEQVRVTIGQTLFECAHPDERAVPDDIQHRLAQTLRLIWWHEKLDDMMHDLGFDHRSATLQAWFDDLQRGRDRHNPIIAKVITRFRDDLESARQLEKLLRAFLSDPDGEHFYDHNLFESIMQVAFDAALRLEANFETQFHAEEAEAV